MEYRGQFLPPMRRPLFAAILIFIFALPARAQHTYYVSSSGSDANTSTQAQSKSTPWAHLPCMANASGNAAGYTPVAGDKFELRIGDSWLNASFPCTITQSGTSGSHIYFGNDDPTWAASTLGISEGHQTVGTTNGGTGYTSAPTV